ncbi:MAG TPA: hypothetical protein H9664_00790 [Firmicutes bacterium]|mgnify:FL=1|nr:hypothetical protein [Bacillota bacterium]
MKKLVCLMLAAVLALCIAAVPAAAAELPTPWTDDSLTIWVIDDFTGEDTGLIGLNTEKSEGNKWVQYTNSSPELSLQYVDNALRFYYQSAWTQNLQLLTNGSASLEGANLDGLQGIGMYLENNTENVIGFKGHLYANEGFFENLAGSVYYVVQDGEATENTVSANAFIEVPAGFKGYVMFPLTSLGNSWANGAQATVEDAKNYQTDRVCLEFGEVGAADQTDSYLLIDDIFFYGEGVTDNTAEKGDIDLSAEQPGSEQPGNEQPGTGDDKDDTSENGDSDILLFAGVPAAVLALGALAVNRRKSRI